MFKTKKQKRADAFHKNFDEEFYYENGDVIDLFSDEQKAVLYTIMEKGYPVKSVAYPSVSAECMKAAMEFMYFRQDDYNSNNITALFIHKVVMIFKEPEMCTYALLAKGNKVDIFEEFDDVRTLSKFDLAFIAEASTCGENVCKKLNQGMTYEEIENSIKGRVSLRRLYYATSDFLYCLKYPTSELTRLKKLYKKERKKELHKSREESRVNKERVNIEQLEKEEREPK